MANEQLARVYAQAVFEQAVERWRKALRAVVENLEQARDPLTLLDNPAEEMKRKQELVNRLLPPNADNEVRNFVYLLASRNQVHLLPEVLAEFDRYAARGPRRELVRISAAIELTGAERAQLEQKIRAQYGQDIDFEYRVDKSLLGGVVVRIGDKVIDGSVAGKLAAMRQKLEATR
jgi:F-type H+-transporting ATPase subunit delta